MIRKRTAFILMVLAFVLGAVLTPGVRLSLDDPRAAQNFTDDTFNAGHVAQEDLQNMEYNFLCLKSSFSGGGSPANPVAGMWWYDTTADILKLRNETNNAWLNVYDFANQRVPLALLATNCSRTVVAGTGITVSGSLNGGNVTVGLSSGGVGATQLANGAVNPSKLSGYTAASTYIIAASDSERSVVATTWTIYKEVRLDKGGSLRISFDLYCPGSGNDAHARIYRNGSAVGIARERTAAGWQTFTEDISGWSAGDLVQLYAYHELSQPAAVRNYRLYSGSWPVLEVRM